MPLPGRALQAGAGALLLAAGQLLVQAEQRAKGVLQLLQAVLAESRQG